MPRRGRRCGWKSSRAAGGRTRHHRGRAGEAYDGVIVAKVTQKPAPVTGVSHSVCHPHSERPPGQQEEERSNRRHLSQGRREAEQTSSGWLSPPGISRFRRERVESAVVKEPVRPQRENGKMTERGRGRSRSGSSPRANERWTERRAAAAAGGWALRSRVELANSRRRGCESGAR